MQLKEKKAKLVFTSRLTPKPEQEQKQPQEEQPGLPVSSEVLFRTTVSNVGGRSYSASTVKG